MVWTENNQGRTSALKSPELRLWQAVIWRALQDCANEDDKIRLQAQGWMRGQTDYFYEVCNMADFKAEYVMKAAKVLRDLGCIRGKKWLQRAKEKTK
jgi:hypothetical protein